VLDRETDVEVLASTSTRGAAANGASLWPSLSGDGRLVAFGSWANNLAPGSKRRHAFEAYLRDLFTGETIRLEGSSGPATLGRNGRAAERALSRGPSREQAPRGVI
jgi:hypothetical protein